MSVTIHAACTGCDATAIGGQIQARYVSTFGGGIHHIQRTPIEDAAPEGWVLFDPYTLTTYCPTCWASIVDPDDDGCDFDGRTGFCRRDHECPEPPDLDGEDLFPARIKSHRDAITDLTMEATRD